MAEIHVSELKKVPLFAALSKKNLRLLTELFEPVTYQAGEEICRQSEFGRTGYYVKSGELRVLHINPVGELREVGRMGPGDFFGETSLLLGEPRDATVVAVRDATLLRVDQEAFQNLLAQQPAIRKGLQVRDDVANKLRAPRFKWQDPDEVVVIGTRKHSAILYRHIMLPFVGLMVGVAAVIYGALEQSIPGLVALILGIPLTLATLVFTWYLVADHYNDNYVVTNKRVVHEERKPLGRQSRAEAPLRTVQDIQQSQTGLLAQIYNFGDLIIETAGERGHVVFRQIPNPEKTQEAIFHEIERAQARARAEERAAIRDTMRGHFGLQPPREKPRAAAAAAPQRPGAISLLFGAFGRFFRYFFPPLRQQYGDTITWRKHWVALIKPVALPTVAILAATALAATLISFLPTNWPLILIGYAVLMIPLIVWWIWRFDDWQNDIYQVTPTRIIDVERLPFYLRENRREASLDMIQNVKLEIPGLLARLFDYGSVTIETAGAGAFTFEYIQDPRGVQAEIFRRMEAFQQRQQQMEADRHRAELLDWFSVYDQIRGSQPPAGQKRPVRPPQQES